MCHKLFLFYIILWLQGKVQLYLPAGRTEAILVCADAVPAKTTDLIAAGAGKEVDVVYLQGLHAQWALHWVLLHLRATGHPMAQGSKKCRRYSAGEDWAQDWRKTKTKNKILFTFTLANI